MISPEDAREFSEALGQVGEGWWRQIAWAFRQGMHETLGMSRREWVEEYHGYLRLGVEDRQRVAKELAAEGLNNVEIADTLGVGEATVRRDLSDSPNGESDGSNEAGSRPEDSPNGELDGDEWYTPRWLFDAFGIKFSMDVCAPIDRAHSSVPAERFFTIEDDGLAQPWAGTVWCNPPYSKPEPWARRMIHHGDGLLLTHMPMNAGWCVDVWDASDGIRLFQAMEFVRPDGTSQRPGYWLQLAAFGSIAADSLARLQPLGSAAFNKRRVASPMWRRA